MRYVTVLGAGLLVGTALAVIIPEGVHALYMSELETNQMQTQHEYHSASAHKIAHRHLNHIDPETKNDVVPDSKLDNEIKNDVLPPVHEHTADRPRELGSEELGHKHSDTTHSAIGLYIENISEQSSKMMTLFRRYSYTWLCIYACD